MLKKTFKIISMVSISIFFSSCSTPYIKPEVKLPSQSIKELPSDKSMSKLVIFNQTNPIINGGTKILVVLDGKKVGQLNLHEYLITDITKGNHKLHLEHLDMFTFKSDHNINIQRDQEFLQVKATPFSNSAKLVNKPQDFEKKYIQAYFKSEDSDVSRNMSLQDDNPVFTYLISN